MMGMPSNSNGLHMLWLCTSCASGRKYHDDALDTTMKMSSSRYTRTHTGMSHVNGQHRCVHEIYSLVISTYISYQ